MVTWKTDIESQALHTVLILSDEPETATVWETLFQQRDCVILRETTLPGALQSARIIVPSITVIDMRLSQTERALLCKELRKAGTGPILMLVSADTVQQVIEANQAGADECLVKPVNPAVLVIKAMAWVSYHRNVPAPVQLFA